MSHPKMTSQKPYLIPALYEWILDNNCTPYIAINTAYPHLKIPRQFYDNPQLVLNLTPSAVNNFHADNLSFSFNARFSGISHKIYIPFGAIDSIFAQETGQGMIFMQEQTNLNPNDEPPSSPPPSDPKPTSPKPVLNKPKLVR